MKLKSVYHFFGIIFSAGVPFSYALKDMSEGARENVLGVLRLL